MFMVIYVLIKIILSHYKMCLQISVCFRIQYSPPEHNKSLFLEQSITYFLFILKTHESKF